MTVRAGTVYLVGAGPGDPSLITVRGRELLERADVVLFDRLVAPELLELAPAHATLVDVGKRSSGDSETQSSINAQLVAHAQQRRIVVRLKGGDPLIFGRAWEERAACMSAGIPCEIVPGISSALAGPTSADIPVTLRGVASSLAIVAAPNVSDTQLASLSAADTCVFLMGVRELPSLVRRLIDAGKHPDTPAAIVERATLPGQRTVRSPLHALAAAAARASVTSPAIVVVGATAAAEIAGYHTQPLIGRRILVTRPHSAAYELTHSLRALGAEVVHEPLISISSRDVNVEDVLGRIDDYDWLVFTSRHGVRGFRRAVEARGDVRSLGRVRIAAVGPTTVSELTAWGIRPDLVPSRARVDALTSALLEQFPKPRRVLFPAGTLARDAVVEALGAHDVVVDALLVYETQMLSLSPSTQRAIGGELDAVLLASPSAARAFVAAAGTPAPTRLICLGEGTALPLLNAGWTNVHVASVHSDAGMIAALIDALQARAIAPHVLPQALCRSTHLAC